MDKSGETEDLRILAERATVLARETLPGPDPRDLLEVVAFQLAGATYALELTRVREVAVLRDLTPAPGCPAFVLGIVNLRGEIHTVIDLKKLFVLPESALSDSHRLIVLDDAEARLGILADAILGTRRVLQADLQAGASEIAGTCADYRAGVTADRMIVLDAARILEDPRILVDDSAHLGRRSAALKPPSGGAPKAGL